jgi:hypothetical protein
MYNNEEPIEDCICRQETLERRGRRAECRKDAQRLESSFVHNLAGIELAADVELLARSAVKGENVALAVVRQHLFGLSQVEAPTAAGIVSAAAHSRAARAPLIAQ